mmetsp:Transcript_10263/g.11833  ORF Transcript_10263/g.11833 Transcript_10263/m.11833 type:complete len:486 (+) Transcript_10263:92-1549(+)
MGDNSQGFEVDTQSRMWLLPVLGSSLCWALSDVLCDICIEEEESDTDSDYECEEESKYHDKLKYSKVKGDEDDMDEPQEFDKRNYRLSFEDQTISLDGSTPRKGSRIGGSEVEMTSLIRKSSHEEVESEVQRRISQVGSIVSKEDDVHEILHMDGEMDAAVSGIVATVFSYISCVSRLNKYFQARNEGAEYQHQIILWSPSEDVEWWFAATGGVLLWAHYVFVLWAFDFAPSTVINPLVQVSSVWVLLGSAVPTMLMGTTFIRPLDLFCYFIIIAGGMLPSLNGNARQMCTRSFWSKPFVRNVVLSEVCLGFYDLMVSYCLQASAKKAKFQDLASSALENEFFFVAWCWFSIAFAFHFAFLPRLTRKVEALPFHIPIKTLFYSAVSQVLTIVGFYLSSFAYAWFYQASVVHATESSLQQAFNLTIAYLLRILWSLGRDSAITGMKYKVISCVVVSFGLGLIAYQDQTAETSYFEYNVTGSPVANP